MSGVRGEDLLIRPGVVVPHRELAIEQVRSGGPGGQNVNKVSTKVVLRFAPATSSAFTARDREFLMASLADRLTTSGELVIHSSEHRSVERNLEAARVRLAELLRRALTRPTLRRATRPTRGSKRRRLDAKRRSGETKRGRGGEWSD